MIKVKKWIIASASAFACFIMLLPASSLAVPIGSSSLPSYTYGGTTITMGPTDTLISDNNQAVIVAWTIDQISHSGVVKESFSNSYIKRIDNTFQNSVVRVIWNQNVKAAEIFSFENGHVDASISVQNLQGHTATYVANYVMKSGHTATESTGGFFGGKINIPFTQKTVVAPINSNSWSIANNFVSVSWQGEMSLFHSGIFEATPINDLVSLPFGPFSLMPNSTYSIDPTISLHSPSSQTSSSQGIDYISPMCIAYPGCTACPCSGGGGGGSGGGGGTTYYPASLTLQVESSYSNTINASYPINLWVNVSYSGNSNSVSVNVYAKSSNNGSQIFVGSHTYYATGNQEFEWHAAPGNYSGFVADATTSNGKTSSASGGHSFGVWTMFPYLELNTNQMIYPNDAQATKKLYNASGDFGGYFTINMLDQSYGPVSSSGSQILTFESSFLPYNTSTYDTTYWEDWGGVNEYKQIFTWEGNSIGFTPSNSVWIENNNVYASDQGVTNSSATWNSPAVQSLWIALQNGLLLFGVTAPAGYIMSVFYPIVFANDPNSPTITGTGNSNQISVGYNAGFFPNYIFIANSNGTKDAWMFNFTDDMKWYNNGAGVPGYTSQNAIMNYFVYSSTFYVSPDGSYIEPTAISLSVPIYLAES